MRLAAKCLLALLFFISSGAVVVGAQTIQIKLVNGKTGHPVTYVAWLSPRTIVSVAFGPESDLSLSITTDKQGIVRLRFTADDSEINVPDCKGERAAWDKLLKNRNKKDEEEFNKKYANCTDFPVNNPVVRFADTISIGPVIRTLGDRTYFRYVPCWSSPYADGYREFPAEEILQRGIVTENNCGKAAASPEPGLLILFVRPPTNREAWQQMQ